MVGFRSCAGGGVVGLVFGFCSWFFYLFLNGYWVGGGVSVRVKERVLMILNLVLFLGEYRGLGVGIFKVRSLKMDRKVWTEIFIEVGGFCLLFIFGVCFI